MIARYTSLTDIGRHRDHNEDAIGEPAAFEPKTPPHGWLFAVADGMGGHADGEVASQLAVRTLFETYYASSARASEAIISATYAAHAAVRDASAAALQHLGSANEAQRMGTTLVACAVVGAHLYGVSIGDSRAYLLRGGALRRLTHDQTFAAEQVRRGLITDDQAKQSHFRSVLLQALGHGTQIQPERFDLPLFRGDLILLCSDGLHGVVEDSTIQRHLAGSSLESAAHALIDAANENGGPDNISVVIVECA